MSAVVHDRNMENRHARTCSSQNECVEVALDNHVLDRCHCFLQQIRVRRVCVVDVDFLLRLPYEVAELVCKELHTGLDVGGLPVVVWEYLADWAHASCYLFPEEIDFVEEENQGRLLKVLGVRYGLEEH